MNPDWLLKHFEQISEAPDAVPRLRRFILDLAVRGKLVEQGTNDEPASEILKRIEKENAKLLKEGKIRKSRALVALNDEQKPFDRPKQWEWVRLGRIGFTQTGTTPPTIKLECFGDYIPFIKPADLTGNAINYSGEGLSEAGIQYSRLIPRHSVLMVCIGSSIGKVNVTDRDVCCNQQINTVTPYLDGLTAFVSIALKAAYFQELILKNAGMGTLPIISKGKWEVLPIPLPPLAEQNRIVAKAGELMALCDKLEAAQAKRERRRDRLVASTLHGLNNGGDGSPRGPSIQDGGFGETPLPDFHDPARFYLNNLSRLTTKPEHIQQLHKTILNLAVRGKLVPQDSNDEPVSDLLDRISVEQRDFVKLGRIKKRLTSGGAQERKGHHPIPREWYWAPLADLILFGPQNGISPKPTNNEQTPKALTLTATTSGFFDPTCYKHVELSETDCGNYWLSPGDVLFQRGNTREYVGISAVFHGAHRSFVFPDLMIRVRFSELLDLQFVHMALISPPLRKFFAEKATGASSSMPKISQEVLLCAPIPIPPAAEQHRIVAKVDELMTLCYEMEARLTTTANTRRQFLEAVLAEALASSKAVRSHDWRLEKMQ